MIVSSFYLQRLSYNPMPLSVCLMLGAVGMVLTGVITINEAYRSVDWRTVFLLGGLIPLGMSMNQTGTAQWIARGMVSGLGPLMTPLVFLIVMALLSCGFTMVISNVGACTLLIPLGISIAHQIGINPRVAAIVVGLGFRIHLFCRRTRSMRFIWGQVPIKQRTTYKWAARWPSSISPSW